MKIFNYFQQIKARHSFNADNCRSRMQHASEQKRDAKIGEITERIKFVVSYETGETTVSFRIKDDLDYDFIAQHFIDLGFIVVRKQIEELNEEYMLISWRDRL